MDKVFVDPYLSKRVAQFNRKSGISDFLRSVVSRPLVKEIKLKLPSICLVVSFLAGGGGGGGGGGRSYNSGMWNTTYRFVLNITVCIQQKTRKTWFKHVVL